MKTTYPLYKIFTESMEIFFTEEIENILNDVAERNLCGRLAIYITEKLREYAIKGYYADPEYNRNQNGKVKTIIDNYAKIVTIQCDLIVHSRGKNIPQDNLIAIEMKKAIRPLEEKESDRIRLRALTKESYDDIWSADGVTLPEHVCGYDLGVFIELDSKNRIVIFEYYERGQKVKEKHERF